MKYTAFIMVTEISMVATSSANPYNDCQTSNPVIIHTNAEDPTVFNGVVFPYLADCVEISYVPIEPHPERIPENFSELEFPDVTDNIRLRDNALSSHILVVTSYPLLYSMLLI